MCHVAKTFLKMKNHNKFLLQFDETFLNKLLEDKNSCVYLQNCRQHLALRPYQLNDIISSIKNTLNEGIAKYNRNLDGILFGYKNLKLLSSLGAVYNDTCFTHLDIEADFFVFKPVINSQLRAIVNKKSKDHIGCLVHNMFNVSLPKPESDSDWLGHSVHLNNEILITILETNFEPLLPYIKGKIISVFSEDSGISTGEESYVKKKKKHKLQVEEDKSLDQQTSKKRKKSFNDSEISTESSNKKLKFESEDEESPKLKKKQKESKVKVKEEQNQDDSIVKKKSKRHKVKLEEDVSINQNNDSFSKKSNKRCSGEVNVKLENTEEDDSPKKKRKRSKSINEDNESMKLETTEIKKTRKIKKEKVDS